MRIQVGRTAQFGDLVAAAFDQAACYSGDSREVARLATGAVTLMLRHASPWASSQPQPTASSKAANSHRLT
jgi:hypothetical protein